MYGQQNRDDTRATKCAGENEVAIMSQVLDSPCGSSLCLGADMLTDVFPLPWCGFRIICTLSPNWEFNVHCEFPFAWMRKRRMLFLSACK